MSRSFLHEPRFLSLSCRFALGLVLFLTAAGAGLGQPLFSFGAIADCQYADQPETNRKYRQSIQKLTDCVATLNERELAFVVHLGDFIDKDWKSFDAVSPIFERLRAPSYHVLGNHDFAVADERKKDVPARLKLKARYYDFAQGGFRFVVLDGNDISLIAHPKGTEEYKHAEAFHRALKRPSPTWNGALGDAQAKWLEATLAGADAAGEKAILFCHFPIYPANNHNLWNDTAVGQIIDRHRSVVAYVNGHNHAGNYGERNGVHYLTLKGMVDTTESAYSVIEVHRDRLEVVGFGRQEHRTLKHSEKQR